LDYVDLHSHILPGLDDGSPDLPTSLAMIDGLAGLGFSTICATPHQKTNQYLPTLEAISVAHKEVLEAVKTRDWQLRIPLAAENMWDSTLYERMESGAIPGYDDSKVFLMEFVPNQLPLGLFERIFDLRCKGMLPVVAHPERYSPLWKDPETLEKLASDCAMVVDLGALGGHHGRKQAKYARKMVLDGTAHAAASDAHCVDDIRSAASGIAWLKKKAGEDATRRLLSTNPAMILEGKHPHG
jgi:protein-tyrosine phosphatase